MNTKILAVCTLLIAAGCTEIQSPSFPYGRYGSSGYPPYGGYYGGDRYAYYDPYYRRYPYDDYYRRRAYDKREHDRWRREHYDRTPRVAPPSSGARYQKQECPPGFHFSTKRCTDAERRRGCKDIGLSGGVGCRNKPG